MLEPEPEAKRRRTSGGSEAIITSSPPPAVVASPDVTIATAPVPTTTSSSSQPPSPSVTALLPAPHPLLAPTLLPPAAATTTTTTSTPTTVKKGGRWSREEERGLLTGISVRYPRDAEVQLADDPQAPFKLASFVPSRSVAAIGKRIKALQARVRSGNVRDGLQLPAALITSSSSASASSKGASAGSSKPASTKTTTTTKASSHHHHSHKNAASSSSSGKLLGKRNRARSDAYAPLEAAVAHTLMNTGAKTIQQAQHQLQHNSVRRHSVPVSKPFTATLHASPSIGPSVISTMPPPPIAKLLPRRTSTSAITSTATNGHLDSNGLRPHPARHRRHHRRRQLVPSSTTRNAASHELERLLVVSQFSTETHAFLIVRDMRSLTKIGFFSHPGHWLIRAAIDGLSDERLAKLLPTLGERDRSRVPSALRTSITGSMRLLPSRPLDSSKKPTVSRCDGFTCVSCPFVNEPLSEPEGVWITNTDDSDEYDDDYAFDDNDDDEDDDDEEDQDDDDDYDDDSDDDDEQESEDDSDDDYRHYRDAATRRPYRRASAPSVAVAAPISSSPASFSTTDSRHAVGDTDDAQAAAGLASLL